MVATAPLSREERDKLRRLIDQRRREALHAAPRGAARIRPSQVLPRHSPSAQPRDTSPLVIGPSRSWPLYTGWRGMPLTPREEQVVELRRAGRTHAEIAAELSISAKSSARMLSHARKKLA